MEPCAVMKRLLLAVLLLLGCTTPADRAEEAAAAGDYSLAAELLTQAAAESVCPARGWLLLRRAEIEELANRRAQARTSIDRAIANCPTLDDAYWMRAQRARAQGERDQALQDARHVRDRVPEAAELYNEISMEMDLERRIRAHAAGLTTTLAEQLDPELPDAPLELTDVPDFARQVPIPITLGYEVRHSVSSPREFQLGYQENLSYRGDPSQGGYTLVRSLELPALDNDLPQYFRLAMGNQRLPMRFDIDSKGTVLRASWLTEGPGRGMRPGMLKPEIEGTLKRRRVFDPGREGKRQVGERWQGEDVRVVDGKPVPVRFDSEALAWQVVRGIRVLHIKSELQGTGYAATEEVWLHPETAVPVRVRRGARYQISQEVGADDWVESLESALVSISGTD